ncbi:MAG TPA: peptidyl-prolyl cis-trans isomerase [Candidatus Limnocylindria bacterium]|nr:peptidyl-prolyl cis-trans isomerase [Candidatus Limnocylindria bacterium]
MIPRATFALGVLCAWSAGTLVSSTFPPAFAAPAATTATAIKSAAAAPAQRAYLPDTAVLARVDGRPIRASEFVESYFGSYPEFRPAADSAGRVEFLNSMINKEILGRIAKESGRELGFEDRLTMRQITTRVLGNVLFQRLVLDSIRVTDADVRQVMRQFARDLHLREITFDDPESAESVRRELAAKRLTWEQAARRHRVPKDAKGPNGDIGWIARTNFDPALGLQLFDLKPGQTSPVIEDPEGYHLFQVVAERKARDVPEQAFRGLVRDQLYSAKARIGSERLKAVVGQGLEIVPDSANLRWAASQFKPARQTTMEGGTPNLEFDLGVPEFAPKDTSRVLMRYRGGQLTLRQFLDHYLAVPPMTRPNVHTPELMRLQLEGLVLEPLMEQYARERGLDRDSMAVAKIEARREQILVERMYADSIESRVFIPVQDRRRHYQENQHKYTSWADVRFAALYAPTKASADSLVARLKAGEQPQDIIRADSLTGFQRGMVRERRENEGGDYQTVLFEEMRQGDVTIKGPDGEGAYVVIQLIRYNPRRQLSFEEADHFVEESLRNLATEKLLDQFLARHKKGYRIEAHPELVTQVRMVNPAVR